MSAHAGTLRVIHHTMHTIKNYTAGGLVLIALLAATPALADSDHGSLRAEHDFSISAILKSLKIDSRIDSRITERIEKRHASSTHTVSIRGTVSAVSGTTLTLASANGGVHTVAVNSSTVIQGDGNTSLALSNVRVGDTVRVKGALQSGVVTASKIVNTSAIDNSVSTVGTMSALSGSTITLVGSNGATYSVLTTGARIDGSTDTAAQLAKYRVGDSIHVKGSLFSGVITATKISNTSLASREALTQFNGVRLGEVTTIGSNIITIDRFGTGSTSVFTSATTFYAVNGSATTSSAVKLGTNLLVFGPTTTTGSSDSITASVVLIIDSGVKFFQRIFGN